MKQTRIIAALVLFSLISFSLVIINLNAYKSNDNIDKPSISRGNTIIVNKDGSGDFTTIQAAIDASSDWDTIQIYPGIYQENLIIKANIFLQGINKETTILKGTNTGIGIYALSKQFEVRNLTITNFEKGYDIYDCWRCTIENNIIKNVKVGFNSDNKCYRINIRFCNVSEFEWNGLIIYGTECAISNNYFNNSLTDSDYLALGISCDFSNIFCNKIENLNSGTGFYINGKGNIVQNNNISNCFHHGINVGASTGTERNILQNVIIEKCDIGIFNGPINCNNITIRECASKGIDGENIILTNSTIINNYIGISLIKSKITNNIFIENSIGAKVGSYSEFKNNIVKNNINHGLWIFSTATSLTVEKNSIENNKYGIFIDKTQNSNFLNNHIEKNKNGILAQGTSGNTISGNEFIDNTVQASTDSFDKWYSDYPLGGNYWSDHVTKDVKRGAQQILDGSDGIGDVPYLINLTTQRDIYPLFRDTIPPVANAGPDFALNQGDIYLFNSSRSTDDQLVHRVEWEFDYGEEHKIITEKQFEFRFNLSGTFYVNLTVYDYPGHSDRDDLNITVFDMADPIPITQGDITIKQGKYALFDGSLSRDNSAIVNYTWRFLYEDEYLFLFGIETEFRFMKPGYYDVTLIVTDSVDRFAETTFQVTVLDTERPIANAGADFEINNGDTAYFYSTLSTDNGLIADITWSFIYANQEQTLFGDGVSFTFVKPGYYNITLTISDQFGNSDTDHLILTVVDVIPPNAVIKGTTIQENNEMIKLDALSSTDNGMITKYYWKFTDTEIFTVEGPYLNHTFEKKGKHNISLTVYDWWNLSDTVEITIEVIDNQNPIAVAGNDAIIPAGTTFTFNGSGSIDDGDIVEYIWLFDYKEDVMKLEGKIIQFKFDKAGNYNVILKVIDQSDNYGTDDLYITVIGTGVLNGIITDIEGNPINGAKITVKASDGKEYSGTSLGNGSFSMTVPMGNATYTITKSGYEKVTGTVYINPMQTTELDPSRTILEKEEKKSGLLLMIIIIVAVVLILFILSVVVFAITRKKKPEEKEETPKKDLPLEEELSQSVIQKSVPEAFVPIQENSPVPPLTVDPIKENQSVEDGLDIIISEIKKDMDDQIFKEEIGD